MECGLVCVECFNVGLYVIVFPGFVDMCVQHIPSPLAAAKTKVSSIFFHSNCIQSYLYN